MDRSTTAHAKKHGHAYPVLNRQARYKHLDSTRGRLGQFIGGHFADVNLSALHFAHRLDDEDHVKLEVWSAPGHTKPSFEEAKRQTYKPAKKGDQFGPSWTNHWFKVTLHIPKEWEEYERVQLEFDCSGEAMVFNTDGEPYHGLTGGFEGDRRVEFIIPDSARKAGVAHYYIEASCNAMFGQNGMDPPDQNKYYRLNSADLVVPNMEAWRLMWDFDTLRQIVDNLPGDCPLAQRALYAANEIMNVFQQGELDSVTKARKVADDVLGQDWEAEIERESKHAGAQQGTLWGVGHCHIDTAWLWPFSVTQQKSARSWSTQCDLMDRFPEHRFSATQAQQFKWTEQLYPGLFQRIKDKVAEGKFQPLGCTWVEMDTNMPSGEALCRQFLYGQRYYESRFGFRSKTFVLPDTFGYSSQLPQICRQSGAQNFFTQKLSWNAINKFPHSTFNWVGLDGSQVLTHMTPVDNYNSQCNIDDIRRGMTGNKTLEVTSHALLLFGNGDGGGGPTPPMLEKLRRARAVGKQPGAGGQLPLVKMGGSFGEFYEAVRKETKNGSLLPIWYVPSGIVVVKGRGELYFELHRGTYTSHGSIKKGNRKSEILMCQAEFATAMASLLDSTYKYPKEKLDAAWEDLLLCQFHDVLPGSAIAMVYDDAEEKYLKLQTSINDVIEEARKVLFKGTMNPSEASQLDGGIVGSVFAINSMHGYPRREVVWSQLWKGPGAERYFGQISPHKKAGFMIVETVDNGLGAPCALPTGTEPASASQLGLDAFVLKNGNVAMKIEDGRITSIVDLVLDKELIPNGQTAGLVIMEDHPNWWDAWDVDPFHLEKQTHLKFEDVKIQESGPLHATLMTTVRHGQSEVFVEISLDAIAASLKPDARSLIRFDAVVNWREKHKFLKFELPLDIYCDNATYDTQFGTVSRPTHRNTTWDAAKFEVCGHKFADLSEYGYGVALINDCKYGYATEGNVMRLSLLRGPTLPDPETDMGHHSFSFAIYPHVGTYIESDVSAVSYAFNAPLQLRFSKSPIFTSADVASLPTFKISGAPNVYLETIKRGEDDVFAQGETQTLVLRVFEQYGGHAKAKLEITGLNVMKVEIVNILEDHIEDLKVHQSTPKTTGSATAAHVNLEFRGYEIKSVRLTVTSSTVASLPEKIPTSVVSERRLSSSSWVKV